MSTDTLSLSIINALPEHIAVINQDGVITHTNRAWDQFALDNAGSYNNTSVGVNYLEICRQSFGVDRDNALNAEKGISDVLAGRRSIYSLEYPCHSEQEKRWFLMNVTPLPKPEGGAVLSHINITERKLIEESRRVAEIGYWEWDLNNNSVFLSEEAQIILCFDNVASTISFDEFINSVYPDEREIFNNNLLSAVDTALDFKCDLRIACVDNQLKFAHLRAEILRLSNGEKYKVIGSIIDITDLRRAQDELKSSESRFRAIFHNAPVMIDAFSPDGQCLLWNNECQKTLGWSLEELHHCDDIMALFYPDEEIKNQVLTEITQADGVFREYQVVAKDLSVHHQLWANYKISKNEIIGVGYDITARKKAEEELKHNEEQLRLITDSVPALIAYVDTDERYRYVNGVYETWFGLKKEQVIGQHLSRVMGDSQYHIIKPHIDNVLSGKPVSFENIFIIKEGVKKYISASFVPFYSSLNTINGFISVVQDVTNRKKASETIRLQTEILENMSEGVHLVDHNGIFIYTNPTFDTMFGYKTGELLGEHVSIINAPTEDDPEEVAKNILDALAKADHWIGEVLNKRKDGSLMWCHANVTSFTHSEYGELWLTVQEDISERKQTEEEAQKSQELLRTITDTVPVVITYIDNKQNVSYINNLYEEWFGFKATDQINKHASQLIPDDLYKQHEKYLLSALDGYDINYETTIPKLDGTDRHLTIKMTPHIQENKIIGITILAVDVTDFKNQEQKRLQQTREQRDQLVKEVHHRIKNNLQAVSGLLRRHINTHTDIKPYIEDAISQVNAIAIIHGLKSLHQNEQIDLKDLLISIIDASKVLTIKNLVFNDEVESPVYVAEHESVPVALIINELLINAVKHGSDISEKDTVNILFKKNPITAIVEIRNSGQIKSEFDFNSGLGLGMGLNLVKSLLPAVGMKLKMGQQGKEVVVTIHLNPPVINIDR